MGQAKAYIDWKRSASSPTHVQVLISLINFHLASQIGAVALDDVDAGLYRSLLNRLLRTPPRRARDLNPPKDDIENLDRDTLRKRRKTANTVIGIFRNAAMMAWEDGKTSNERCWRVFRPIRNVHQPRTLFLSRDEARKLIATSEPAIKQLILGALYTGCRVMELIIMTARDVARDGYGVYVAPGKTFKPRFVFLPDEGMAFFLEMSKSRATTDEIFRDEEDRVWTPRTYKSAFKKALTKAGLPERFCFHCLRHTYASQLVQAGAPFTAVSEQLGHANPTTVLRTYGHLSPQIREAEVRQRFTSVSSEYSRIAKSDAARLQKLRKSMYGDNWREYAQIGDLSSRARTIKG